MKKLNTYISNEKISSLDNYINEKLKINKLSKIQYNYYPKNLDELRKILKERLAKDKNANLNDIDVSKITNMSRLFQDLDPHNINISDWDVSNVENMYCMFSWCGNFDSDLSDWDVSNVEIMNGMFYKCTKFTGEGLENWKVSKDTGKYDMFGDCPSLKNKPSWYK